jgi:hypothetical protein
MNDLEPLDLAPLVVFLSPFESGEEGLKLEAIFS